MAVRVCGWGILGCYWALAIVAAGASPPAVSSSLAPSRVTPPAVETSRDSPPPVSGELSNLTLREAVPRLTELTGLEVVLPEPEDPPAPAPRGTSPTEGPAIPRLDLDRRVTLTWRNTPLAQALREFCRAYGCRFDTSGELGGSLYLNAGPLPGGPTVTVGGYTVEVGLIHFRDERTADLAGEEAVVERGLDLQLLVRARSGDPTPIYGFHNVRVVDEQGRDALEHPGDRDVFGLSGAAGPTAFPDERRRHVSFPWPYALPRRLRVIEGDLLLYSQLRRVPVDLRLPRVGDPPLVRRFGPAQLETKEASFDDGRFTLSLHLAAPAGLGVQVAGALPRAKLVFADGTSAAGTLSGGDSGDEDDGSGTHLSSYELTAAGLKQRPVRVLLELVMKSEPDRRLHFRFNDYPAVLSAEVGRKVGQGFGPFAPAHHRAKIEGNVERAAAGAARGARK